LLLLGGKGEICATKSGIQVTCIAGSQLCLHRWLPCCLRCCSRSCACLRPAQRRWLCLCILLAGSCRSCRVARAAW
jgi:hypothetical protein